MNKISDYKATNENTLNQLRKEIRVELRNLTNLVKKKCSVCSKFQKENIYFCETNQGKRVFLCSLCIIKLAINDLIAEAKDKKNKKDLKQASDYLLESIKGL